MNDRELARKLVEETPEKRKFLLTKFSHLRDAELAKSLQQICYEVWTNEPQKVSVIVQILEELVVLTDKPKVRAYAEWTKAIENLVNGKFEDCLLWLDKSEKSFQVLGDSHTAATTQISKLYALALLGRYDEAVACGLRARAVFLAHKDFYSVGKIEHNIGNLYWRRDFYRESEPYLASAHRNFEQIGDQRQLAMVENCQAFVLALQNEFRAAQTIYQKALARAAAHDLTVTAAEIETGMSNLYLFQGRLDLALKFMERSRQKYDALKMPHQSANCELEIADIYLELNLLPEALEFYERSAAKFAALGMQAELGRSSLNHARALFLSDEYESATDLLDKAEKLFAAEGNSIAVASARLAKAQFFFRENKFDQAKSHAQSALNAFISGGNRRQQLFAQWLLGEIWRKRNETAKAKTILRETLQKASEDELRQIKYLCLISLGKITGEERVFREAVDLIENSRAALSAEEFRTAFFSDKLAAYQELVKIKLAENNLSEALSWHERSRSKTLLETMNDVAARGSSQNSEFAALRDELNWFYSRINRQTASGLQARREISELRKTALERERELAELERRLRADEENGALRATQQFDLEKFQTALSETTVVEFAIFDNRLWAFVVTNSSFDVFRYSVDVETLSGEIKQFLFQIKTGRFLEKLWVENRRLARSRLLRHSQTIYDWLIRPLEKFCRNKRLVIVPTDFLHRLPFQALHDGRRFLIEQTEISRAPSLAILQSCLKRKLSPPDSALLVGVADKITPLIETEIEQLGRLFKSSVRLANEAATLENLSQNVESANVLHLACHGNFRVDNPAFSSLNLFAENLTASDAQKLNLQNKLVVLSACETGLNKIVAGDELLGLTRGFLNGGASSLVISLWTVNDKSTLDLMSRFYSEFLSGRNLSESLQTAQVEMLEENSHPYFWAAFALIGRW